MKNRITWAQWKWKISQWHIQTSQKKEPVQSHCHNLFLLKLFLHDFLVRNSRNQFNLDWIEEKKTQHHFWYKCLLLPDIIQIVFSVRIYEILDIRIFLDYSKCGGTLKIFAKWKVKLYFDIDYKLFVVNADIFFSKVRSYYFVNFYTLKSNE